MIRRPPVPLVSRTRAALFGLLLAIATLPLVIPLLPFSQEISEGDIAPRTLEAAHDAHYDSAAATNVAREAAAQGVQPVPLPLSTTARQQQLAKQSNLLDQVRLIRQKTTDLQQRLDQLNSLDAAQGLSNAGRTSLFALDDAKFDLLQRRADKALAAILAIPVTKPDPANPNPKADPSARIADYLAQLQQKQQTNPSTTADPADLAPDTVAEQTALTETLKLFLVYNDVDTAATAQKKDEARKSVPTVSKTYTRGQVIVTEGERINSEAIEALRATGVIRSGFDAWDTAGGAIVALAFAAAIGVFTYLYQPFSDPANRRMILVGLAVVASLVVVRIAEPIVTPDTSHHYLAFALPVAAAAIIAAAFADLTFAAVVAVLTGLLAAFIGATLPQIAGSSFVSSLESLELAAAYIAGGLAGAVAVHRADHLSRYALAALATAVATGAVMGAFWLVGTPRSNIELGWMAVAAISAGVGSAVIGLAAFVLLSMALGVTTRLQLMELTQPEHPLMRRLQDEAPGTYHHSMMVGALAERGAARIGADALVARVGSYYHDIGKLARPSHYIENMLDGTPSPHDSLAPSESAAIIREHVTTGLEVARKYRLPALVRDFIPQHHGTRLVTYFYRRAAQAGEKPDPATFRYAGPRPQSKETAIVMLADSCEAVVRARQEAGNPSIDELVDGVFAERLAEGQLDECDITMRELQQVAASFKTTLRAVYHPRVAYPTPTPEELAGLARGDGIPNAS
jgi:putative nucleotidyltransferase with HDIG domain